MREHQENTEHCFRRPRNLLMAEYQRAGENSLPMLNSLQKLRNQIRSEILSSQEPKADRYELDNIINSVEEALSKERYIIEDADDELNQLEELLSDSKYLKVEHLCNYSRGCRETTKIIFKEHLNLTRR